MVLLLLRGFKAPLCNREIPHLPCSSMAFGPSEESEDFRKEANCFVSRAGRLLGFACLMLGLQNKISQMVGFHGDLPRFRKQDITFNHSQDGDNVWMCCFFSSLCACVKKLVKKRPHRCILAWMKWVFLLALPCWKWSSHGPSPSSLTV